jgi:hypothetical protein
MRGTWRAIRTSIVGIAVSAALVTSWLALPQTVAACSCFSGDLAAWSKLPDSVIFSGTVRAVDAVDLDVAVDRWFHGDGIEAVVHLDPAGFGSHGESCQAAPPPPGTRWLFGAGRTPGQDLVSIGLCSLRIDLSTQDGQAEFATALKLFPNAVAPPTPLTTDGDIADPRPVTPTPALTDVPASDSGTTVPSVSLVVLVAAAAALGALHLATRRRRGSPD